MGSVCHPANIATIQPWLESLDKTLIETHTFARHAVTMPASERHRLSLGELRHRRPMHVNNLSDVATLEGMATLS